MKYKKIAMLLAAVLTMTGGCGAMEEDTSTDDLANQVQPNTENSADISTEQPQGELPAQEFFAQVADFSIGLFAENYGQMEKKENAMISPISILPVMTMVENGAAGETLSQMQQTFAPDMEPEEFSENMSLLQSALNGQEVLTMANSIWINTRTGLKVDENFKETNQTQFQAAIQELDFNEDTVDEVNQWVSDNTKERITEVIRQVNEEDMLYLINGVSFDATWLEPYDEYAVGEGEFTTADGEQKTAEMMRGEEQTYYQGDTYTGFSKPYEEGYTFLALLPNDDASIETTIQELQETGWEKTLEKKKEDTIVYTMLPKFQSEYSTDLKTVFQQMGMLDLFDEKKADLSGIPASDSAVTDLYVSEVIHKTFIQVDQKGTQAGAVTAVIVAEGTMLMEEYYEVNLDRPFFYVIMENETQIPVFMGVVNTL